MSEKEPSKDSASQEKIENYREMLGDSKAIFVLSMGNREIVNKEGGKTYIPNSYSDLDPLGNMGGGHSNVIAAAEIAQYFPELTIIATSYNYKNEDEPTMAQVYARELINLGVPEEKIELEEKSKDTMTELFEMVKIAKKHGWNNVSVLTNETHTERVQVMLEHLEELAKNVIEKDKEFFEAWEYFEKGKNLQVHLLQSEQILPMRDPRYQKVVDAMRSSEPYKKRLESEKRGAKRIENGTYFGNREK